MYYVYRGNHRQLTDLLRCAFVFDEFKDLYRGFETMKRLVKTAPETMGDILRAKDGFEPTDVAFGYRQLLVNVYCPGTRLVCEIQFHHSMFDQFQSDLHRLYTQTRLFKKESRNLASEYVKEYVLPTLGEHEHYQLLKDCVDVKTNEKKEEGEGENGNHNDDDDDNDNDNDAMEIDNEETLGGLLRKWFPDTTKTSPDGIFRIDVNGTPLSYLQILGMFFCTFLILFFKKKSV
ncbi:hypothetical protein RFI_06798 [Reticulomyxa filosa]|uniref:Uncharacterized protein n=1 Tax=Reticulomyxa filosa TaxID=46433 RepID=X6NYF5_RETFI|nr:hypothetical protein RFI_06798 [Reticulomyxa filosa]|eukprot:ETO30322.1 hypothetical protein RFI_06798 [Reticulomyxa filosa]